MHFISLFDLCIIANLFPFVFIQNEKELKKAEDATRIALLKDADKRRKLILRKLSQGRGFMKHMVIVSAAVAVGAVVVSQNMQSWDIKKVLEIFNWPLNFCNTLSKNSEQSVPQNQFYRLKLYPA